MKFFKKLAAVVIAATITVSSAVINVSAQDYAVKTEKKLRGEYAEGEVLVTLKKSAGTKYLKNSSASALYGDGIRVKQSYSLSGGSSDKNGLRIALLKSKTLSTEQLISQLKKNKAVADVSPNYRKKAYDITDDTYSRFQWALENKGEGTEGLDIKPKALWDAETKSENDPIVAIIDTGIDLEHEDLKDCLWENPFGKKLLGKHGLDLTGDIVDMSPMDDNGHGTHVAGIIAAAANNKKGISGISPEHTKIMAVKGLDKDGGGYDSTLLGAFEYIYRAKKLGANVTVINCSWGGYSDENEIKIYDKLFNKLGEKGIITCVAAGNERTNLDGKDEFGDYVIDAPASSTSPYCITVASVGPDDKLSYFSNYGRKSFDVAAQGDTILSSVNEPCFNVSLYDKEKRDRLCSYYQNFDGELKEGDFGYPEVLPTSDEYKNEEKVSFRLDDKHFGSEGKSLRISFDEESKKKNRFAVLSVPYTVEDEKQPYSISVMASCTDKDGGFYIFDADADADTDECLEDIYGIYTIFKDWGHYKEKVNSDEFDDEEETDEDYDDEDEDDKEEFNKNRKLVIIVMGKGDFYIDDLAVSKQGADSAEFEKYDFYRGTSMATPYVTGAVALLRYKRPELSTIDAVNTIINTGRPSAAIAKKVKSGKVLCLDNLDELPPMINSVKYNSDGNVEIDGSFHDISAVEVNDNIVYPLKSENTKIIIPDDGYSAKPTVFTVKNKFGEDSVTETISKQKLFEKTKLVKGDTLYANSVDFHPAGNRAYSVDKVTNTIALLEQTKKGYKFHDNKYTPDYDKIYGKKHNVLIISSEYKDGKIYMLTLNRIMGKKSLTPFAYESKFCCYDLKKNKLTDLGELPDEITDGASLVYYKKNFYILGGYDLFNDKYLDSVYKYNAKKAKFTLQSAKLPSGRAYSEYIVCSGKIVGVYGAQEDRKIPQIITFDGKSWKTSKTVIESEDFVDQGSDKLPQIYPGSLGYHKNGVFCNGAFITEKGTALVYNVKSDKLTAFSRTAATAPSKTRVYGTTLPNCFIGFSATDNNYDYDDDDYFDDYNAAADKDKDKDEEDELFDDEDETDDDDYFTIDTYLVKLKNNQAVTEIVLSKTKLTLRAGKTATIKPTILYGKGKTTYKSSNKRIVKVNSKGKITALKKGKAKITVKNNGAKATVTVTVKKKAKKKIVF